MNFLDYATMTGLQILADNDDMMKEYAENSMDISDEEYDLLERIPASEFSAAILATDEDFNWENEELAALLHAEIDRTHRAALKILLARAKKGEIDLHED